MILADAFPPGGGHSFCAMSDDLYLAMKREGVALPLTGRLALSRGYGWLYAWPLRKTGVYRDAEFNILLYRKRTFVFRDILACISFNVQAQGGNHKPAVVVTQIQGVRGRQRELAGYRWEKALLTAVMTFGKAYNCGQVRVLRSEYNSWLFGQSSEEKKRSFHVRYDVIPRRMGFRPGIGAESRYHILALA